MFKLLVYIFAFTLLCPLTRGNDIFSFLAQISNDNVNQIDNSGLKQGYWIIKAGDRITEEGNYVDSKKDGIWKAYFENRNLKTEITYVNGEARGKANFYYEDGTLRESGNWQVDHWEGSYKYYFESGKLSYDWFYNKDGKRQGEQKYYHANGNKMYEGNWNDGKTEGVLKVYNETGLLVQEKIYNNGKFAKIKKHTNDNQSSSTNTVTFAGTGFHTLLNLAGQIEAKGFFVKGKLFNGEKRKYDKEGNLISVISYKNGEIIN